MHVYSVNFFYRDASFMTPSQVFLCFQSSGLNTDISSKLQFYENSINYDQEIQQARNFIWYVIHYWYQKAGNLIRFKTAIKHKQHAID